MKERNLQREITRGKEMIVPHNNQSSQPSIDLNSSQSSAATSTRIEHKHQQENKLRGTESKRRKTTKMLTTEKELGDVMMKLEGKLLTCWSFLLERLSQQHVMKLSTPIKSLLEKNTRRSLQRTTKPSGAHVFGVHRICICSCRGREKRP